MKGLELVVLFGGLLMAAFVMAGTVGLVFGRLRAPTERWRELARCFGGKHESAVAFWRSQQVRGKFDGHDVVLREIPPSRYSIGGIHLTLYVTMGFRMRLFPKQAVILWTPLHRVDSASGIEQHCRVYADDPARARNLLSDERKRDALLDLRSLGTPEIRPDRIELSCSDDRARKKGLFSFDRIADHPEEVRVLLERLAALAP